MRLFIIFLILVGSVCNANAQDISRFNKSGQIVYTQLHNGKPDPEGARLILTYENGIARLVVDQSGKQLIPEVPTEATYLDYIAKRPFRLPFFRMGSKFIPPEILILLTDLNPRALRRRSWATTVRNMWAVRFRTGLNYG